MFSNFEVFFKNVINCLDFLFPAKKLVKGATQLAAFLYMRKEEEKLNTM